MKHLAWAIAIGVLAATPAAAEDGYDLWLRYVRIDDPARLQAYTSTITSILVPGDSPTAAATARELRRGLQGLLLGAPVAAATDVSRDGTGDCGPPPDTREHYMSITHRYAPN